MMNTYRTVIQKAAAGILMMAASLAAFGSQDDASGYALLIQQSPADGGTVSPGTGVHKIGIGQSVQLVATPRPGYKFIYWLGDVSGSASAETSVSLDSPKMVIAVFAREGFEEEISGSGPLQGGGGGSGLRGSPSPLTGAGGASPAGANYRRRGFVFPDFPDFPDDFSDDFPVPGDPDGDFPVPGDETGDDNTIPEPATISLLGLGMMVLLRKRK